VNRPEVLFFDINETLLELTGLRAGFVALFGSADVMGEWFARLLHASLVSNHVSNYRPFDVLGVEVLQVMAHRRGVELDADRAAECLAPMRRLDPHPEVPAALQLLRDGGYRMAALTNNPPDILEAQLAHTGLVHFFERLVTVDGVRRFKPAPEVYLHACALMDVEVDRALMLAAHDWDIVGARSVGMSGAFIARPSAWWGLPDRPPEVTGPDLEVIARLLVGQEN
jgi:2-haloacid dehalogenase